MDDFKNYIKQSNNDLTSGDTQDELITDIDSAIEEMVNTPYSIIFREMLIGFIILAAVPETYINMLKEHVDVDEEFKFIKEKLFKDSIIYRLNPGKEDEEDKKEEKPKTK